MAEAGKTIGPTVLTTSAATLYTVPGSTSFYCRYVSVTNVTASTVAFSLSIGTDALGTRWRSNREVLPYKEYDWSGFLFVPTGTVFQAFASVATSLNIIISGTEVT